MAIINQQTFPISRYINLAITDYRYYTQVAVKCKSQCKDEAARFKPSFPDVDVDDLHFFERLVGQTLCLMTCKSEVLGSHREEHIPAETIKDFETKNPYNYLQLCYHQVS